MPEIEQPTRTYRVVAALSRPVVRHGFRLHTSGLEHVPTGGFVLCANHLSALDAWALSVPLSPRQPRYMAKATIFHKSLRPVLSAAGVFPVEPGRVCVAAVRTAIAHARAGRVVVVFPEGARRKKVPWSLPQAGAARIALAAGVPLVPAAISGTERLRDAPWRVAYGPPVDLADLAGLRRREAGREATKRLWRRIESLREQIR